MHFFQNVNVAMRTDYYLGRLVSLGC